MAEKLDPSQVVTFEELLRAIMMEQDATRRVLVRKGLLTNEEVLEEIKVVRREMEGKRGRVDATDAYSDHILIRPNEGTFVEVFGTPISCGFERSSSIQRRADPRQKSVQRDTDILVYTPRR